jgi:hypothetical protein
MPVTVRAVQTPTTAGLTATYTAVDNTNDESIVNTGDVILHVKNGSGGSLTVTEKLPASAAVDGTQPADKTVTIGAGADKFLGPWPSVYNQSDGTGVRIGYSTGTTITAAALRVPKQV